MFKKIIFIGFISLLLTACHSPTPPDIIIPTTMPTETMPTVQPRVAVVLGGGGIRGFAELGVLKVLEENHIPVDLIVGTSMGSIIGAMYADNPDTTRLLPILLSAKKSDLLNGHVIGPRGGLDNGYTMQNFLLKHIQARDFKQLKIKFVAVATDFNTGEAVILASGPLAPAINASAALPPVFHPVHLYGRILVDGWASQVVPVETAKRYNPIVIIAIDVSKDPGTKITSSGMMENARRFELLEWSNHALHEAEQADIVIKPAVGLTGTFDVDARPQMVQAGEAAAEAAMPQIKALLKQKKIIY